MNPNYPDSLSEMTKADRRNVVDHYKAMHEDWIKADLNTKRLPFVVVCENFVNDFNIATTIRNCNAFSAREITIVGDRRYDRRGTVGTHVYENIHHEEKLMTTLDKYRQEDYTIVAVDNVAPAVDVFEYTWNPKTVMVLGQEQVGLSNEALFAADDIVFIPMTGSTRSLNVGVASGIMMAQYVQQIRRNK